MDKIRNNKKRILKSIGNVLVIVAILFLVKKYHDISVDVRDYLNENNIIKLLSITMMFSLLISLQFIPWALIVRVLTGTSLPLLQFYKVFQRSNIMKYIPGNIFQYVGRGEIISDDNSLNVVSITTSVLLENGALLIASLLLGVCGFRVYMVSFFMKHRFLALFAIICVTIAALSIIFFRTKIKNIAELKGIILTKKIVYVIATAICFFFLSILIQAFFQILIIRLLSNVYNIEILFIVGGAYSLSWLAGYLTPGASGGLGVREALFCLLLEGYVAADIILVAAVIFRAINIIADIIAYGVSVLGKCMFKPLFSRT